MDLLARFLAFIEANDLFLPNQRVLLAVSGGKDSVLMAQLFLEAGFIFGIAHVNFGLRGVDSVLDEDLVRTLANRLHVPFYRVSFETAAFAKKEGVSIEMAARMLRYDWFEQIRTDHNYDYIALAHHQNDVIETMLFNLTRGTGLAGLHGILPKRGRLIRPMLFLNGSEIIQAVQHMQLDYRDDQSNFDTEYIRNKIRWEVVPVLKTINPALEQTFVANAKRFRALEQLVHIYMERLRAELFVLKGEHYHIDIEKLQALQPLDTMLYELFKPFHFTSEVLHDLVATWASVNRTGKQFSSDTHRLWIDRDVLILERQETKRALPVSLMPEMEVTFGGKRLTLQLSDRVIPARLSTQITVDAQQLQFPLIVRAWQEGDWFRPFGMHGRKKLSDFFISLKITHTEKKTIPIVINGNGDILWVAPYRMDNRYKITDKTEKIAILECI